MTDVEQLGLGRELLPPRAPRPRTLTLRALFVGLIGVAAVCFIVAWAELVTGQIMIGFLQLPPVVIAALFVLVLLVKGMRRISPRLALQPGEMVVVYVMMLIASMISSRGLMEDLIPTLVRPGCGPSATGSSSSAPSTAPSCASPPSCGGSGATTSGSPTPWCSFPWR
jgi:hypothetical protein